MIPYKKSLEPIQTTGKCGLLYWDNLFDQFPTKRIFYLSQCQDLDSTNDTRGKHVNHDCNEILVVLQGSIEVDLTVEEKTYRFECMPNEYVFIPIDHYLEIKILSKDTIYFVLADSFR
jgi:mannose-6-phosphate isomerase-like protein (cupin superfamily)